MGHGLKRLRGRDAHGTIAQLNRTQYDEAVGAVNEQRPAPLPRVTASSCQQLRAGLKAATLCMKEDCMRRHKAAKGTQRQRLYGELLGYDAVLKVLANVELV